MDILVHDPDEMVKYKAWSQCLKKEEVYSAPEVPDVPNVPDVSENYEQEEKTEFMQHLENAIDLSQKLNHEAMEKSIEINKSAEYIH